MNYSFRTEGTCYWFDNLEIISNKNPEMEKRRGGENCSCPYFFTRHMGRGRSGANKTGVELSGEDGLACPSIWCHFLFLSLTQGGSWHSDYPAPFVTGMSWITILLTNEIYMQICSETVSFLNLKKKKSFGHFPVLLNGRKAHSVVWTETWTSFLTVLLSPPFTVNRVLWF